MQKNTVDMIGVPMDYGGNRRGVDMGPSAIRYSGLKEKIEKLNLTYHDSGDINVPLPENQNDDDKKSKYVKEIICVNSDLYKKVLMAHKSDRFPLIIGGDHSLAVGSCLASLDYYKNIGVVWIDAHADFNNSSSSLTGNIHGMPLAAIAGKDNGFLDLPDRDNLARVEEKNIVIIAARDLDIAEVEILKASNITVFSMQYIDKYGMHDTMKKAIDIASNGTNGIHVSFDLDAITPKEAPGVGTPVKGGLTYRESHLAMELLAESKKVISLDVVELNPIADNSNMTGDLAVSLIQSSFGKNII